MFPEDKIIEIFSMCDDFSRVFDGIVFKSAITRVKSERKREYHRDGKMSDSEVMTIPTYGQQLSCDFYHRIKDSANPSKACEFNYPIPLFAWETKGVVETDEKYFPYAEECLKIV